MSKLSSYQKLKAELEQAKADLRTVVMHPDSNGSIVIKTQVKMNDSFTNMVWFGGSSENNSIYDGIINKIK